MDKKEGNMKTITLKVEAETREQLDSEADERGFDSRSSYLREIIHRRDEADELQKEHQQELEELRDEHETEIEELNQELAAVQNRLESRETRIEELEQQLARRSQIEEKIESLPDKIRDRESYQERRQRMLDQASLAQRLKWKVTGVPVDNGDQDA
jgi:DNA repair ATPase RecN